MWIAKIKGKKSTKDSLNSALILKTRPKHTFYSSKVPKKRCVIFCPPPFSGLFLRGEKWFSARCENEPLKIDCSRLHLLHRRFLKCLAPRLGIGLPQQFGIDNTLMLSNQYIASYSVFVNTIISQMNSNILGGEILGSGDTLRSELGGWGRLTKIEQRLMNGEDRTEL
jgi:hypothetical protein